MRIFNRIFQIIMIGSAVIAFGSCKKKLDTNLTDPNGPGINSLTGKDIFAQALLSTAVNKSGSNITDATDNYDFATQWMGYLARTTSFAPSGGQEEMETFNLNNSFGDGVWSSTYHNIYDYNFVIANSSPNSVLVGAARVMRASLFQNLVDIFGDIPYTQAAQPTVSITPTYDKATDIYPDLVKQIDTAITELSASQSTADDASDIMFKGSKTMWIAFANTMKLRILLRQVPNGDQSYVSTEIQSIVSQGGGFLGPGQDASMNPGFADQPFKQNPFWANYGFLPQSTTQSQNYNFFICNSFMLNYLDSTADPRLGLFYRKNSVGGYGGNFFGSSLTSSSDLSSIGTGILQSPAMPAVIFSAAQSLFMQAEAVQRGLMSGNYKTLYQEGVEESFRYLMGGASGAIAAADAYMSGSTNAYVNINSSASPLATIMYQKWVSECELDGFEAYCDYRRLGLPNIPVPSTAVSLPIPKRELYPESEYNQNAANVNAENQQPSDIYTKIFWGM